MNSRMCWNGAVLRELRVRLLDGSDLLLRANLVMHLLHVHPQRFLEKYLVPQLPFQTSRLRSPKTQQFVRCRRHRLTLEILELEENLCVFSDSDGAKRLEEPGI